MWRSHHKTYVKSLWRYSCNTPSKRRRVQPVRYRIASLTQSHTPTPVPLCPDRSNGTIISNQQMSFEARHPYHPHHDRDHGSDMMCTDWSLVMHLRRADTNSSSKAVAGEGRSRAACVRMFVVLLHLQPRCS